MKLAEPAPWVEPAIASSAAFVDPAQTDCAPPCEPATADPAPEVEPATASSIHSSQHYNNNNKSTTEAVVVTPMEQPRASAVTVSVLRGNQGAELECYAAILRGAPQKNILQRFLPCLFDERDFVSYGEVKKYMVIKANTCFVFGEETNPSPMYAIPLHEVFAILENYYDKPGRASITISPLPDTNKPPKCLVTVLLKYRKDGKHAYQFTFDTDRYDKSFPKRFMDLVNQASQKDGRHYVTASVVKAECVAQ